MKHLNIPHSDLFKPVFYRTPEDIFSEAKHLPIKL